MTLAPLLTVLLAAAPAFQTDGGLEPQGEVQQEAASAWRRLEEHFRRATGEAQRREPKPVRVRRSKQLAPGQGGAGRPGLIELRQSHDWKLDERERLALRHEVAHQFLWAICPAGADDRLFHEAFAVATSGEVASWSGSDYLSLPKARKLLERAPSLDTRDARRALSRLVSEDGGPDALPSALSRRLRLCAAGASWGAPMTADELASPGELSLGDALVVVSRHSGELLQKEGAYRTAMPFGSTLKPFLVAGARAALPELPVDPARAEWACGTGLPKRLDARGALLRSCNGYFLDWAEQAKGAESFGDFGNALLQLGLERLPREMSEAIGIRAALSLSPVALAQAWRLLADARPELIELLRENARSGTLSGLEASKALRNVATKTGTVRDAASRPRLGLIVAVTEDVVAVMVRKERMPRAFAGELVAQLERAQLLAPDRRGLDAASVQVFGLLAPESVEVRCAASGFRVPEQGAPASLGTSWVRLSRASEGGRAICLGAPWLVRFPGEKGREYAGVFESAPAPPWRGGDDVPKKAQRARRGSDFVFRTTRLLYVAGVLNAEDARIDGQARTALGRVIAHNERHSRHEGRPVCDTTHCQTFKGTPAPKTGDVRLFELSPLPWKEWLPFSRGGDEPWEEERPLSQVERAIGTWVGKLTFRDGEVHLLRPRASRRGVYEEPARLPCEVLRNPLKLPSCPDRAVHRGSTLTFSGRGEGHGEGLDVERAKKSKHGHEEILRQAYGGR